MTIVIEPANPGDIPGLIALLDVLFSIEQDFCPDAEKQRRGLSLLLNQPDRGQIFVARQSERGIVGMVSAQLVISTAAGAASAWIEDVFVTEECRGTGLGRRLLEAATAWAGSRGAKRVQLLVDADNQPALGFYRHLDWEPTRLLAWRQFTD